MAVLAAWPRPGGAVDANGPWGVHPHCIAPAIPLEAESWWLERGERVPKHLHLAACVPNARTADCSDPANPRVTRPVPFTSRVTSFNNRGPINWIRWSWQSDVQGKLRTDWRCEPAGVEHPECGWMGDMTLDPAEGNGGLDELRLSPNIAENEFDKRHFATLNAQVCTGASSRHYRSRPDPIARGRRWRNRRI
jgi:hypothetical protein